MKKISIALALLALFASHVSADNTNSIDLRKISSQYLFVNDASQTGLDIAGNRTMETWIKVKSQPEPNVNRFILSKWNGTGNQRSIFLSYRDSGGVKQLGMNLSDSGSGAEGAWVNVTLSDNVWYHIAIVWNASASTYRFYVNGVQTGGDIIGSKTSCYNGTAPFAIGTINIADGGENHFDGLIDDVRIWNVVRTAAEITANYQKELVGNEQGLVSYWKLNNNTADSTANGNNLTNGNGAIFSTDVPFTATTTPPPPPPPAATCSISGNTIDIVSLADINSNGFQETVTMGIDSSSVPTVCITDVSTKAVLKEIKYFAAGWVPKNVYVYNDMSIPADGIPDISVMATNTSSSIQIRDTKTGSLIIENPLP